MLAEWSVECASEDPVLVVPWRNPDGSSAFVDLRANPYDFEGVTEAEQHPPLMQALRALNAARSPVFTAKCDAWQVTGEELESLQLNLDIPAAESAAGFASYIDLIWRDRSLFASLPQHQQLMRKIVRLAEPFHAPMAATECVLRPALLDFDGPQEGYAISLYIKALGHDPHAALQEWGRAIEAVVALIRGKEFAPRQARARTSLQPMRSL